MTQGSQHHLSVQTRDGTMTTHRFGDENDPIVLVLMAALGADQTMRDIARRLADNGYFAVLPDLYYRWGHGLSFNPATDADRIAEMLRCITDPMVISDIGALLATLESRPTGAVGFCMGGRFVVRSMGASHDRIVAGSALHPSHLLQQGSATSPHLDFAHIAGEIYRGFGANDPIAPQQTRDAVRAEVERHGTRARIDVHPNAGHGFMLPGPNYQQAAAESSWVATFETLRRLHGPSKID